jgi:hypothetical protein
MLVKPREAPGITHDYFLDCGRATTFPTRELTQAKHEGCSSTEFLERMAQTVEKPPQH